MNGSEFNIPGLNLFNLYQYLVIFFIASLRISSFLISAPFFSGSGIPLQARIVVSIAITAFLFPIIKVPDINEIAGFKFTWTGCGIVRDLDTKIFSCMTKLAMSWLSAI